MLKKVAFVFTDSDIEKIEGKDYAIFPQNSNLKLLLTKKDIKYYVLEDFFNKKDRDLIQKKASTWASTWTSPANQIFSNLNLSLYHYFSKILFLISCLVSLFDSENVEEIFLGTENRSWTNMLISKYESITPLIRLVSLQKKICLIDHGNKEWRPVKQLVRFLSMPKLAIANVEDFQNSIIFASHHYHVNACLELIAKLNRNKKTKTLVLGKVTSLSNDLKKLSIDHINYGEKINNSAFTKFVVYKVTSLMQVLFLHKLRKSFKFNDLDVSKIVSFKIISLFLSDIPDLKIQREFFISLLGKTRPKLIITVTNDSLNQLLIDEAKKIKIPTVEIQHGLTFGLDNKYTKAENIIVWGEFSKKIYQRLVTNKAFIGGWPEFENYKQNQRKIKNSKNILFLAHDPQGISSEFLTMSVDKSFEIFFGAISELSGYSARIRLHPRADIGMPFVAANKYNVNFKISKNTSLKKDILWSDIVVCQTTAASLPALMLEKPVIYLSSMKFELPFLEKTGAVYEVDNKRDATRLINFAFSHELPKKMKKDRREFLQKYCNFEKDSVESIFRIIKGLNRE